jgi:hypothetical protein
VRIWLEIQLVVMLQYRTIDAQIEFWFPNELSLPILAEVNESEINLCSPYKRVIIYTYIYIYMYIYIYIYINILLLCYGRREPRTKEGSVKGRGSEHAASVF